MTASTPKPGPSSRAQKRPLPATPSGPSTGNVGRARTASAIESTASATSCQGGTRGPPRNWSIPRRSTTTHATVCTSARRTHAATVDRENPGSAPTTKSATNGSLAESTYRDQRVYASNRAGADRRVHASRNVREGLTTSACHDVGAPP
ncbi:hypothetical protein [Cellulosimicrobium sp. CUA-896]|uniref:hypothetical protein n=1 Tax=Cellulosimicrobium sp. CUA-896 TaxID=1517881 RepID=UPI00095F77B4|nr:hypothetical protein [Cellulosimicrobium sp. CUA-896]OLT45992.1 hypothetical protein BJF88_05435 [Cellulosimicrobium sp. CUA-896]